MHICIHETVEQRPNGDRATHKSPSSKFEVVLVNSGKQEVLYTADQFDPFYTHIQGTRAEYLETALARQKKLADVLGCSYDKEPIRIHHQPTTPGRYIVEVTAIVDQHGIQEPALIVDWPKAIYINEE